ncbi:uncharacterized protein [Glycine max]|uniref:uncharacterized protein n=1 Tax=Glycine max TaxID=3847 RepID=UPI001B3575D0|nr:uncharacterized protein LOC106796079 [Glycine max]
MFCLSHLENGCSGVFVMVVSSRSPKTLWRVVGLNGTLQVERGFQGQHGYLVSFYGTDGQNKSSFFPFSGVTEELKAFINDVSENTLKIQTNLNRVLFSSPTYFLLC